jgi:hypothetical protein
MLKCLGEIVKRVGRPNHSCWWTDWLLPVSHLQIRAPIKISSAGRVLVCEKSTEPEDTLAFLPHVATEDTQKGVLAKLASYRFLKLLWF